jgi:hypothetical protein
MTISMSGVQCTSPLFFAGAHRVNDARDRRVKLLCLALLLKEGICRGWWSVWSETWAALGRFGKAP